MSSILYINLSFAFEAHIERAFGARSFSPVLFGGGVACSRAWMFAIGAGTDPRETPQRVNHLTYGVTR